MTTSIIGNHGPARSHACSCGRRRCLVDLGNSLVQTPVHPRRSLLCHQYMVGRYLLRNGNSRDMPGSCSGALFPASSNADAVWLSPSIVACCDTWLSRLGAVVPNGDWLCGMFPASVGLVTTVLEVPPLNFTYIDGPGLIASSNTSWSTRRAGPGGAFPFL